MEMDLKVWLAPLLTIVGWAFVLFNADRMAKRSEARSLCDKCVDKLESIIEYMNDQQLCKAKSRDDEYVFQERLNVYLFSVETKTKYLQERTSFPFLDANELAKIRSASIHRNYVDIIELSQSLIESLEVKYSTYFAGGIFRSLKVMYFPLTITFWVGLWVSLVFLIGKLFSMPLPK